MATGLVAGASCGGGDSSANGSPAAATPIDPPTVSYEDGVLVVGSTRLTQLPNHKVSRSFRAPVNWPAASKVVIETAGPEAADPIVAAVAFDRGGPGDLSPEQLIEQGHRMIHDDAAPVILERTVHGASSQCRVDVRHGPMDRINPEVVSPSGVIIAMTGDQAVFGLHLSGFHLEQIQLLTVEMAEALCPTGSS